MKISKSNKILMWLWMSVFFYVVAWSFFRSSMYEFPGFKSYMMDEKWKIIFQASAVAGMTLFLSVNSWISRDRVLLCTGISACLMVQGIIYIGIPFGLANACILGCCLRAVKSDS